MPTPAQSSKVIDFNRSQKIGKHYTLAEIEQRKAAEEKLTQKREAESSGLFKRKVVCCGL